MGYNSKGTHVVDDLTRRTKGNILNAKLLNCKNVRILLFFDLIPEHLLSTGYIRTWNRSDESPEELHLEDDRVYFTSDI